MAILENARALVEESELLLNAGHHARAYALAQLATEELAKLPMIVRAGATLEAGRTVDWEILNRRLSDHKSKISTLYVFERLVSGDRPTDLAQLDSDREAEREMRNRKKNEALYSHPYAGRYRRPSEAITTAEATEAVARARRHVDFFRDAEAIVGSMRGSGARYEEFLRALENPDDPETAA